MNKIVDCVIYLETDELFERTSKIYIIQSIIR